MTRARTIQRILCFGAGTVLALQLNAVPAVATPQGPAPQRDGRPDTVEASQRTTLLGAGWQKSRDRLWTTSGDADGLHVLVAEARAGYTWRTVATLNRPGVDTDRWIGNACVTGSGERAVVVYAPRTFTNREQLFDRGGFTAIVDLSNGTVTSLPVRTSLAYFNPGCGAGESVALTQGGDTDLGRTRLLSLDAASATIGNRVEVSGQLTSTVPVGDGFVAAASSSLVRVAGDGTRSRLARTTGVPFELHPDANGGVVFEDADGDSVRVQRLAAGSLSGRADNPAGATTLASGKLGDVGLSAGAGRVVITGEPARTQALPVSVARADVPVGARLSTFGEAAITDLRTDRDLHIRAKRLGTARELAFTIGREPPRTTVAQPATAGTTRPDRPTVAQPATARTATVGTATAAAREVRTAGQDMTDPGAVCAVRRNDTALQVYQPKPKQVEWAVDMAITDNLGVVRLPNWNHNGLSSSYTPRGLFPSIALTGGGRVPAQVMLGILGQESNLWQASRHALPGEYGNPLIGNYYGVNIYNDTETDDWAIDWNEADCGYGVSQLTDGMRAPGHARPGETLLSHDRQVAVATDYAANVAAGLRVLQTKWNQLQAAGVTLNDNDPARLENWFFAVWAYNSGYHVPGEAGTNGAYGLGWLNNPANPNFPADRQPFGANPRDFATPQRWPYPEKVMGFAANPPSAYEAPDTEVPFFRAAWWNGSEGPATQPGTANYNRATVKPPVNGFCSAQRNNCVPGGRYTPNAPEVVGEPAGPCAHQNTAGQYDLKCWWHGPGGWKADCALTCGHEFIRYDYPEYAAEPAKGTSYPSACHWGGLPHDALVVDDVDRNTPSVRDFDAATGDNGCPRYNLVDATFGITFGRDAQGREASKIDLHQIGSGYGGHYWFGNTHSDPSLQIRAKWTLNQALRGRARVLARVPADHTSTAKVVYTIEGDERQLVEAVQAGGERWLDLGSYQFDNVPSVELTTIPQGADDVPVAIDAVAFAPAGDIEWEFEDKPIQLRNREHDSGRCLATAQGPGGVELAWQRACLGNFTDDWMASLMGTRENDHGFTVYDFRIRNRGSGKCLGIKDQSLEEGATVEQDWCTTGDRSQTWESPYDLREPYNGGAGGGIFLLNRNSLKCLTVLGDSTADGVPTVQRDCGTVTDPPPSGEWFWSMSGGPT